MLVPVNFSGIKGSNKVYAGISYNSYIIMESRGKIVVTGGSGYVGSRVAHRLRQEGFDVTIFDVAEPAKENAFPYVRGDICDGKSLRRAFKDAVGVVHSAGFGLSGAANLACLDETTRRVNVDGTKAVVEACLEIGVKALVFTSSLNIGFDGTELIDATESDMARLMANGHAHIDEYSCTKHLAEQIVLATSGIKTCAIRLGGVYGPGEKCILPRSISYMESGWMDWIYCLPKGLKIDFLHIENAVQAHVKALKCLLDEEKSSKIHGQVFNITDGTPMSLEEFLTPLHRAIFDGRPISPLFNLPTSFAVVFAYLFQFLCNLVTAVTAKPPSMPYWALTPMEAYKLTVSHYFNISKAMDLLEYQPIKDLSAKWPEILASYGIKTHPVTRANIYSNKSPNSGSVSWTVPVFVILAVFGSITGWL